MAFRTSDSSPVSLESPEAMYKDLRRRDGDMVSLLPPQAQILRDYIGDNGDEDNYVDESDVAFQLPTGSGKTLIGLTIAEWRRRNYNDRVVYLCPTRQLVHQVVEQSREKYGIEPHAFTGSRSDFLQDKKTDYLTAENIAVTTYSALFNTNPFFDEPKTIILDDIHAAEGYISSLWTVRISAEKHDDLFEKLAGVIEHTLSPTDARKLHGNGNHISDELWLDKIPTPDFAEIRESIRKILNDEVDGTGEEYAWSYIRGSLQGCHLYVSQRAILIRPLIPPTDQHSPFSEADQRIYMSATLGSGGDLERITGRKQISRMSPPPDWQKQGIGRRYFFFPGRSLDRESQLEVVFSSLDEAGRSLFLVPSKAAEEEWLERIEEVLGYETFSAAEIEESKEPFTESDEAVAVVANRYDGIDFPHEDCRFMVLWDLPRAVNLQERFIIERMGAITILQDRITTRIVQAFGRCTREDTDYAAILIAGGEIDEYLLKPEKREFFHPEIQAELAFGIEESQNRSHDDFITNLNIFFDQDDEWNEADGFINNIRQTCEQRDFPGRNDLRNAVRHEITYQQALWREDYPSAFDACREVLAELNNSDVQEYKAMWHYFAGSAAWLAAETGLSDLESQAQDHFDTASQIGTNLPWLTRLASQIDTSTPDRRSEDNLSHLLVERMESRLLDLGIMNNRDFNQEVQDIRDNIQQDDSDDFENGQKRLGNLIGYDAENKESSGSPDPWWVVDSSLIFVFEDYTETTADNSVPTSKARQASGHPNWIRDRLSLRSDNRVLPILVTPARFVDWDATSHLDDVYVWTLSEFRDWAWNALDVIQDLRQHLSGPADPDWRAEAAEAYRENDMDPASILESLSERKALDVLKTPDERG